MVPVGGLLLGYSGVLVLMKYNSYTGFLHSIWKSRALPKVCENKVPPQYVFLLCKPHNQWKSLEELYYSARLHAIKTTLVVYPH